MGLYLKNSKEFFYLSFLFILTTLVTPSPVHASSLAIPRNEYTLGRPARDLIFQGHNLDSGEAADIAIKNRELLSQLNPKDSKLWQNKKYEVNDPQPLLLYGQRKKYYPAKNRVHFLDHDNNSDYTYFARVSHPEDPTQTYRLGLSRYTHAMLLRSALMRKLGYYVPAPQFYEKLVVQFDNPTQLKDFIDKAAQYTVSNLNYRNWIQVNEAQNQITISHATLEYTLHEYYNYHWGQAIKAKDSDLSPLIESFNEERAYRALILPLILADIPESLNRFAPTACEIINENVVLTHSSADSFKGATREDLLWLLQRLGQLNEKDFKEIVKFASFPNKNQEGVNTGFEKLVYATLIYRVHSLFECFQQSTQVLPQKPQLNITQGLVVDGKVTVELIQNSPIRYGHGDRESPFKDGDFTKYLQIEAVSNAIKYLLENVNENLVLKGVEDHALDRATRIQNLIKQHIKEKPNEILYLPVERWGGPVASADLDAGRHITTGTYYESQAPIQLVDTLRVSGQVGYFTAMDGLIDYIPSVGANLRMERNYAHVRPLFSIEEGTQESLKNILISNFMNNLGKNLNADWEKESECKKFADNWLANNSEKTIEDLPECLHPLDQFFKDFREGEVLTITDSISFSPWFNVMAPIDVLMGIQPLNFINNLSFSLDAHKTALWQTSLIRTSKGMQVFFRDFNMHGFGAQFDVNFFLNLFRWRLQKNNSKVNTQAWVIDYEPELSSLIEDKLSNVSSEETKKAIEKYFENRNHLTSALKAVLLDNSPELLQMWFNDKKFDIRHKLKITESNLKFLSKKHSSFVEGHNVEILWPENPLYPELKREDEKVEVYSYRKGELTGWDWFGLFGDILDGVLEKRGTLSMTSDPNPANSIFGNSSWRLISTEVDLSKETSSHKPYKPMASLQNSWGGWNISRENFLDILREINKKFESLNNGKNRIIFEEDFRHVKEVRYYKITSTLALNEKALDKIKDFFLQNTVVPSGKKKPTGDVPILLAPPYLLFDILGHRIIGGIFDLITEGKIVDRSYKPTDKSFYKQMLQIIGQGDETLGKDLYMEMCKASKEKSANEFNQNQNHSTIYYWTQYDCVEPWFADLLFSRRLYPDNDPREQAQWFTRVLAELDGSLPLPSFLDFVGRENFSFFVRINGFREGDEDGDLEYFSNTAGDPEDHFKRAGGILSLYSKETGILPTEIRRTMGPFR